MIGPDRIKEASRSELPHWQQQQLAERLAEAELDPGVLLPAEEVEAELRALVFPSDTA